MQDASLLCNVAGPAGEGDLCVLDASDLKTPRAALCQARPTLQQLTED